VEDALAEPPAALALAEPPAALALAEPPAALALAQPPAELALAEPPVEDALAHDEVPVLGTGRMFSARTALSPIDRRTVSRRPFHAPAVPC
jgi:hypothetical protein